jgi:hypothetical protein
LYSSKVVIHPVGHRGKAFAGFFKILENRSLNDLFLFQKKIAMKNNKVSQGVPKSV